jgi:hypothetical protein
LKIAEFEDARLNPEDFGFRPNQTEVDGEPQYIRAANLILDTRERSVILGSSEEELPKGNREIREQGDLRGKCGVAAVSERYRGDNVLYG